MKARISESQDHFDARGLWFSNRITDEIERKKLGVTIGVIALSVIRIVH